MSLRFLLDEDLSPRVAEGLRNRAVETVSVHELHRSGLSDEDQLAFAAEEGRVLVTYNRGDYQDLDVAWHQRGRTHAGILWVTERSISRRSIGEIIRAIEDIAEHYDTLEGLCLPLTRPRQPG